MSGAREREKEGETERGLVSEFGEEGRDVVSHTHSHKSQFHVDDGRVNEDGQSETKDDG